MAQSPLKNRLYGIRSLRRLVQAGLLRDTPDCVFLWIPKTAGTSVFYWLHNTVGMRKMNIPRDYLAFPGTGAATFGHVHYLSLLHAGIVPDAYHARAYKFAIVRDPYARIVSLYNYLTVDQGYGKSFEHFVEEVRLRRPAVGLYNHRGLSQTNPQADWLMGWDGILITDDIFKVEEIDAALDALKARLRISGRPLLESRNTSRKSLSLADLDGFGSDVLEQIDEVYARDFALFDYPRKSKGSFRDAG